MEPSCARSFSLYGHDSTELAVLKRCDPTREEDKRWLLDLDDRPLKEECFCLKNMICLNFTKLSLHDPSHKPLIIELIDYLINHEAKMRRIFLDDNQLGTCADIMLKLNELASLRKNITFLSAKNTAITAIQGEALEKFWGPRGLAF